MLLFRAGCLAVPARWRITCLDSRSPAGGRICPQHGAIRRILIFQSAPDSRERNKWSEATWFRESARTEHRSGGEAAAKERSGYLLLCAVRAGAAAIQESAFALFTKFKKARWDLSAFMRLSSPGDQCREQRAIPFKARRVHPAQIHTESDKPREASNLSDASSSRMVIST